MSPEVGLALPSPWDERLMGEIDPKPNRSWVSDEEDSDMRNYLGMKGRVSMADVLRHFAERYPHVRPDDIQINFGTVVWEDRPTHVEIADREAWRKKKADRLEEWERSTLARLKEKYGG